MKNIKNVIPLSEDMPQCMSDAAGMEVAEEKPQEEVQAIENPAESVTCNPSEQVEKLTEETSEVTVDETSGEKLSNVLPGPHQFPDHAASPQVTPVDAAGDEGMEVGDDDVELLYIVKQYLAENYELRNNVVAGRLEFRLRDGRDAPFRQLTPEAENSIVIDAMMRLGKVKGLKTTLLLLLHSEDVAEYDPVRDFLTHLPRWDGRNRVAELFSRLPGITSENIYRCTIWLRSAVAHWLKVDLLHGNETVPTLIGDQGCGKTVFCRRLLPPSLQEYFLDRVNLSNKFDKDMALTNNMIVVLDEFDQYSTSQQAALKQVLSRSTVNARQIYKGTQVVRHRYASFLATTNNVRPLNDPTGSRRYLCIRLTHGAIIDNTQPIDYEQLYAQVVEEVCEKEMCYWFKPEETQQIMLDNMPFQQVVDVDAMVTTCFRKPTPNDPGREYTSDEIVEMMMMRYPYLKCTMSLKMRLGATLKRKGFLQRRHNKGNSYVLVPKRIGTTDIGRVG